jgi:hypothetical protein
MIEKVYGVTQSKKQKLITQKAGHVESALIYEPLYWKTIEDFLIKYM